VAEVCAAAGTGAAFLEAARIDSDELSVASDGMLRIGLHRADALVARFGSPLNVVVDATLRANYRRIRAAFATAWPGESRILYSIKANSTLAVRAILSQEGAGGDCFGLGELRATMQCGTDPACVAMNGSDKSAEEIEAAVAAGVVINVDGVDELGFIAEACRGGRRARVNVRLKVLPPELGRWVDPLHPVPDGFVDGVRRAKWGHTVAASVPLLRALQAMPCVDLLGLTCHIGHLSRHAEAFASVAAAFAEAAAALHAATSFVPAVLDLGGGWAPERDPSFRSAGRLGVPIETVACVVTAALRAALPPQLGCSALWLEPGRFLVANAVVLLARVGAIKRDAGHCWMHVDASTNNLPRIESGHFHYTILPASRMHDEADTVLDVVGGTCFRSVLGAQRAMPSPSRGDLFAILDAGMYAEVFATQFNSVPRPATVLLSPHGAEVVRVRETLDDVFRHQRLPAWLGGT
jgi:diaminopimelate decarboxylase